MPGRYRPGRSAPVLEVYVSCHSSVSLSYIETGSPLLPVRLKNQSTGASLPGIKNPALFKKRGIVSQFVSPSNRVTRDGSYLTAFHIWWYGYHEFHFKSNSVMNKLSPRLRLDRNPGHHPRYIKIDAGTPFMLKTGCLRTRKMNELDKNHR